MVKKLIKFYNPQGTPIKTRSYTTKLIKTPHGIRNMAIAELRGKKYYKFIPMK